MGKMDKLEGVSVGYITGRSEDVCLGNITDMLGKMRRNLGMLHGANLGFIQASWRG
jgi:hypothetical protein